MTHEEKATKVLTARFGLEVEAVETPNGSTILYCYDPMNPAQMPGDPGQYRLPRPGVQPAAIVSRNRYPGQGSPAWGCLAPAPLGPQILKALNTGAI